MNLNSNYLKNSILNKNVSQFPKSPLRYPGGKARAVNIILSLIDAETKVLASPFMGGGSIEIAAAHLGIQVYGYDLFEPLVVFWRELLKDAHRLADKAEEYYPLPKSQFYKLQKTVIVDPLERAAVFYALNRSSFSGVTLSGGMSPDHPRFTKSSLNYLRNFKCPNLQVSYGDFTETINKHSSDLLYLDPPYWISSNLYGKKGNTHKDFDHEKLNQLLKKRNKWILSYNNCPEIKSLYSDFYCFEPKWKYGMSNDKESRELLIVSSDIEEAIKYKKKSGNKSIITYIQNDLPI